VTVDAVSDRPSPVDLPLDYPRAPGRAPVGKVERYSLADEVASGLSAFASAAGTDEQTCVLAAFAALAYRHGSQSSHLIGVMERGDRSAAPSLLPVVVSQVNETHPIEWVQQFDQLLATRQSTAASDVWRASASPDFGDEELLAVLRRCIVALGGPIVDARAPCEFVFSVNAKHGLELVAEYDSTLFAPGTISRLLGNVAVLLRSMLGDAPPPMGSLSVLTDAEVALLEAWNDTAVEYPGPFVLHTLIERQADERPDATAVVFRGDTLTYTGLNRRANQLAHLLRARGVGPDALVGVLMERSFEMVVSLVAVLKTGAGYVPLDPEYPSDRLRYMISETRMPIVLRSQDQPTPDLPKSVEVLEVDPGWNLAVEQPAVNLEIPISPKDVAYVIYTSGSTGRPKGVANTHGGVCNLLWWMHDFYGMEPDDTLLQRTPYSFDPSVREIFWPLAFGAKLVLPEPGGHRDPEYLLHLIREQEVTKVEFVPSNLRPFLNRHDVGECTSLQTVLCGGEPLTEDLQDMFFERLGAEFHNVYGPTEAAVDVTYWHCKPDRRYPIIPIGRAAPNTQIHILNDHMVPVPIGVAGELHVGGIQVARGYVNRPDLTAERFVPDPFSDDTEARLYKSGDLARFMADGNIEFIGRRDHQVKVRGFRIELGEIEATLLQHQAVASAVVVVDVGPSGRNRLIGHFVARGPAPSTSHLREYLGSIVPDYMVPQIFVEHDAFPTTIGGKIDRGKLSVTVLQRPRLDTQYVAPRDEVENLLAGLWQEILALERVGVDDRFFDLGADSIQSAEFIDRVQSEIGEFVYVTTVFSAPTVAEYAQLLRRDYAEPIARRFSATLPATALAPSRTVIDEQSIATMRSMVPTFDSAPAWASGPPNSTAVFILSPPRSGTSLLRVMLAGHPDLFAASELQLLPFATLAQRRDAFQGRYSAWLEGTIRALMEIKGLQADEAKAVMEAHESAGLSAKQFYGILQGWIGRRTLVDKSPQYALHLEALHNAESGFDGARYIHLVRDPHAMAHSFADHHMDQVLFVDDHNFTALQLAELVWYVSHENIMSFFKDIPSNRRHRIKFEDLVADPRGEMVALCQSLGLEFDENMLHPYDNLDQKMVTGLYANSTPMDDVHFLERTAIDPSVADRWRAAGATDPLGEITWQLAASLGYRPPSLDITPSSLRRGRRGLAERQAQDRRGRQR
jgi:amino acid adenylation domain-containing protein